MKVSSILPLIQIVFMEVTPPHTHTQSYHPMEVSSNGGTPSWYCMETGQWNSSSEIQNPLKSLSLSGENSLYIQYIMK